MRFCIGEEDVVGWREELKAKEEGEGGVFIPEEEEGGEDYKVRKMKKQERPASSSVLICIEPY